MDVFSFILLMYIFQVLVKIYEITVKENDNSIRKEKVRIESVIDDVHEVSVTASTEHFENEG